MMKTLAIVEDDTALREELAYLFTDAGYTVHEALNEAGLLDILRLHAVPLIVLDLNLPGTSGYQIAESLRQSHPEIGLLMLTARPRVADRVQGYEAGADIYLQKPADPEELLAAVASLERRVTPSPDPHTFTLLMAEGTLQQGDFEPITLTAAETVVLRALALAPDAVVETGVLLDVLNEALPSRESTQRALENTISRLRGKAAEGAGASVNLIRSVRGVGYQLGARVILRDAY